MAEKAKGRTSDIRHLFHRTGDTVDDRISLEAEMLLPQEAIDDLGQKAKAAITFVSYGLVLAYRRHDPFSGSVPWKSSKNASTRSISETRLNIFFFGSSPVWRTAPPC